MNSESQKGFTLVEIMVVAAIIGLLTTLAIPTFQRTRANSINSAMDNDARQLAFAAQQYFIEYGVTEVTVNYNPNTGEITGDLASRTPRIARGYIGIETITLTTTPSFRFTIGHALVPARTYSGEGVFQSAAGTPPATP